MKTLSLALILSLSSLHAKASDWYYSFNIDSFSHSEIAPVKQVFDELKGPPIRKGNAAFTFDAIELNAQYASWKLGAFMRYHYLLNFSADTAELIYADKNDVEVQANKQYELDITANHVAAKGLSLAYTKAIGNWRFTLSTAYLDADQMTDGRLHGKLQTDDNNTVDGEAFLAYAYSKDLFFKREESGMKGKGYTIDTEANWQNKAWSFNWTAKDLSSNIQWSDQDYTTAQASSDNISYDNEGFISTSPLLSWFETEMQIDQALPTQHRINLDYTANAYNTFGLEYYRFDTLGFYRITYSRHLNENTSLHGHYDLSSNAVLLGYRFKNLSMGYTADKPNPEDAYTLGLHVSLGISF